MKQNKNPDKGINTNMVKGISGGFIIEQEGRFYLDIGKAKELIEKFKNNLDLEKRKKLYEEYGENIISFFSDLSKIEFQNIDNLEVKQLEVERGEVRVYLENFQNIDIIKLLSFYYTINYKKIKFFENGKKVEYELLNSKEYIYNHILSIIGKKEYKEWRKKILTSLGKEYPIFLKKTDNEPKVVFGDLHKNEHYGLEFGGLEKAIFLADKFGLQVETSYLDNLTGFNKNFPDVPQVKKLTSVSVIESLTGKKQKINISSIEELFEKKLNKILENDLNEKNITIIFENLVNTIFENLDLGNDFYSQLIGSTNRHSNKVIKLYLGKRMKNNFIYLLKGIRDEFLREVKKWKETGNKDISLLKRKILTIFNNFLNSKIYFYLLNEEKKSKYIKYGVLDKNGKFNKDIESSLFIENKEKSNYFQVQSLLKELDETKQFGENFINNLFRNIFESVSKKKVYLMTLNLDFKNIDFELVEDEGEIKISFDNKVISIEDFLKNYLFSDSKIVSITGKLNNITYILNGDLNLASERGAREIIYKTLRESLDKFNNFEEEFKSLILESKLVDDFKLGKEVFAYDTYPVAFSHIIPKENVLLSYIMDRNLLVTQLKGHNIDNIEEKYYMEINKKIKDYTESLSLTNKEVTQKIGYIKLFLESKGKDTTIFEKALSKDKWENLEGMLKIKEKGYLEKEFITPELMESMLNANSYINITMKVFEEKIEQIINIFNNTFDEYRLFMEETFLNNFNDFLSSSDNKFDLINNNFNDFLSKFQFYTTLLEKVFKTNELDKKIISNIDTLTENIINSLNINNYPDAMILITNLNKIGLINLKTIDEGNILFKENIENIFNEYKDDYIPELEEFFKLILGEVTPNFVKQIILMKIAFVKKTQSISYLSEENDLIVHDYFKRMLVNYITYIKKNNAA